MLTPEDEIEIAAYPAGIQALIRDTDDAYEARRRKFLVEYAYSERNEAGYMTHYGRGPNGERYQFGDTPSSYYFGLSYAAWITLPRVSLQEMPLDWQQRFYDLLAEAEDKHGMAVPDGLYVMRRGADQRWVPNDHWNDYRHGNSFRAEAHDAQQSDL